jgi:hypothetical protein
MFAFNPLLSIDHIEKLMQVMFEGGKSVQCTGWICMENIIEKLHNLPIP